MSEVITIKDEDGIRWDFYLDENYAVKFVLLAPSKPPAAEDKS